MIGIPLGLLYANGAEWLIHKYILHGVGKNKASWWAFHWHDHHRQARKNGHIDSKYEQPPLAEDTPQRRELIGLTLAAGAHLPLLTIAPFFTMTVAYAAVNYYRKHRRSHIDPEWARKHLPWHYDHHMGPNQHANWCVTRPWFDQLMGTREPYVGTEREQRDIEKQKARLKRKAEKLAKSLHGPAANSAVEKAVSA